MEWRKIDQHICGTQWSNTEESWVFFRSKVSQARVYFKVACQEKGLLLLNVWALYQCFHRLPAQYALSECLPKILHACRAHIAIVSIAGKLTWKYLEPSCFEQLFNDVRQMKIKEGPECLDATCINPKCEEIVSSEAVKALVSPRIFETYRKFFLRSYVNDNPKVTLQV